MACWKALTLLLKPLKQSLQKIVVERSGGTQSASPMAWYHYHATAAGGWWCEKLTLAYLRARTPNSKLKLSMHVEYIPQKTKAIG